MGKGDDTRTTILDQALQLASRIGFEALTIGQLAEHTGMSKSGLFAHFKSKEQLQLQTLAHSRELFIDTVIRPTLATTRGEKRVRALFENWLTWESLLPGGCIYVAASVEYDDRPGPMHDAIVTNQQDWLETITTIVQTAISEGDFAGATDPAQFAFEFYGITLAYHHHSRLMGDPHVADRTRTAFEALSRRHHA